MEKLRRGKITERGHLRGSNSFAFIAAAKTLLARLRRRWTGEPKKEVVVVEISEFRHTRTSSESLMLECGVDILLIQ